MNRRSLSLIRGSAIVALTLIGLAVQRSYRPTGITEAFDLGHVVGLLVIFLFWLAAVVGWGKAATRLVIPPDELDLFPTDEWPLALSLGSLIASIWACVATTFGSRGITAASSVFVLGGILALVATVRQPVTRPRHNRGRTLLIASMSVYVVVRFVQATRLARHGDPLYYGLVAPVDWVRRGGISYDPSHPLNFNSSLWEYLYLWPAQWFLGEREVGLPAIQVFAQWTHLSVGWLGFGLVVIALFRRLRFPAIPALLAGFAALATRTLWWTGALAKNDCGAAFWLLSGVILLWGNKRNAGRRNFAAGILIGAAFVVKYTVAFLLVPVLVGWSLLLLRRASKQFIIAAVAVLLGVLVGAVPTLWRNFTGTGLAFFPVSFGNPHAASLSQSAREYLEGLSPGTIDAGVWWRLDRLRDLAAEGPLAIASLCIPLLLVVRLKRGKGSVLRADPCVALVVASFGSLLGFLIIARPGTDFRLLGPGLILLNAFGTVMTVVALRRLARSRPRLRWTPAGFLAFAAIASTCRFAPEALFDRFRELPLQQEVSRHTGGDTKVWAATHIEPAGRIVTTGDNEIYYLLGHDVSVATDDIALDQLWRGLASNGASPEQILLSLRAKGFRYLLDTEFPGEASPLPTRLRPTLERHPDWTVYRGRDARLIDLSRIEAGQRL